ncbi:oligoribonuclease [Candidatus Saccharibacteria bacterium oral taxon 488]|nr:oligoribonuclease [Candidatus Saccharibacteria bacterium oral taxon 488]
MKAKFKPQRILWLDMEMTGLDPVEDFPIEVAMIVTDWEFTEVARFEGAAHWCSKKMQARFDKNKSFWYGDGAAAREQLMAQNKITKTTKAQLERDILAFLDEHFDNAPILLAGNSIHQDRRFIDHWFKKFSKRLHYRMLDVSAWKVVFEGKYGKKFAKPEDHRALEDIRGSIMELKYYLKKVKS